MKSSCRARRKRIHWDQWCKKDNWPLRRDWRPTINSSSSTCRHWAVRLECKNGMVVRVVGRERKSATDREYPIAGPYSVPRMRRATHTYTTDQHGRKQPRARHIYTHTRECVCVRAHQTHGSTTKPNQDHGGHSSEQHPCATHKIKQTSVVFHVSTIARKNKKRFQPHKTARDAITCVWSFHALHATMTTTPQARSVCVCVFRVCVLRAFDAAGAHPQTTIRDSMQREDRPKARQNGYIYIHHTRRHSHYIMRVLRTTQSVDERFQIVFSRGRGRALCNVTPKS
jgi:hypothetical protein